MQGEITKTVAWGKTGPLRVDPGSDGDQVGQVGGEDTGEKDLVTKDNIHFEHVSIKLLLNNWKIFSFFVWDWKLLIENIIFNTVSVTSLCYSDKS